MTRITKPIEGKTKIIRPVEEKGIEGESLGRVFSKDVLTAGDGDRMVHAPGKGRLATKTTIHIFERLQHHGVPLAFYSGEEHKVGGPSFLIELVDMLPVEVVVCNEAAVNGSYSKRNPETPEGTVFGKPVVQFFYKTSRKTAFGTSIDKDDPFMVFSDDGTRLALHHPQQRINHEDPMLEIRHEQMTVAERRELHAYLQACEALALEVNTHLSNAWKQVSGRLVDFKIECGINHRGEVVVADVIDCDSWRVLLEGEQLSKQKFRDGQSLEEVMRVYHLAEQITRSFDY